MFLVGSCGSSVSGSTVAEPVGAVAAGTAVLARVRHLGAAAAAVAVVAGVAADNGQEAFTHNSSRCVVIRFGQDTFVKKRVEVLKVSYFSDSVYDGIPLSLKSKTS